MGLLPPRLRLLPLPMMVPAALLLLRLRQPYP